MQSIWRFIVSRTSVITTRVDPELKSNAEHILSELGITTAQAITMFLKQVELNRGLPFTPRLPTAPHPVEHRDKIEVKTFSLGSGASPGRDELYEGRGL